MDCSQVCSGSSKSRPVKSDASLHDHLRHLKDCVLCKTEQHSTWDCTLKPSDKMARIKELCLNCLVPDHKTCDCPNTATECKGCGLQHYKSFIFNIVYRKPYFDPAKGSHQHTNTLLANEEVLQEDQSDELSIDINDQEDTSDLKQPLVDSMIKKIFFDK